VRETLPRSRTPVCLVSGSTQTICSAEWHSALAKTGTRWTVRCFGRFADRRLTVKSGVKAPRTANAGTQSDAPTVREAPLGAPACCRFRQQQRLLLSQAIPVLGFARSIRSTQLLGLQPPHWTELIRGESMAVRNHKGAKAAEIHRAEVSSRLGVGGFDGRSGFSGYGFGAALKQTDQRLVRPRAIASLGQGARIW